MAQVLAAMALTHSPGLTGWFDRAPEDQRREARRALDLMRERLRAARPDVIVLLSNDQLLNWPINNTPEYTVGIGAEHVGPADWYDEWLALEKYRIPGHPALARYLVNEGARRRLAFAYLRDMQFDDGVSVPMHYLNPEGDIALVPVTMNCTVPPIPTPERAYEVGTALREMVHAYPGAERVAVLATGGLSHEPGGPRACAMARSSGWRRPAPAGPRSCSRGWSRWRSRPDRPRCSRTCPRSPGAREPAWWSGPMSGIDTSAMTCNRPPADDRSDT